MVVEGVADKQDSSSSEASNLHLDVSERLSPCDDVERYTRHTSRFAALASDDHTMLACVLSSTRGQSIILHEHREGGETWPPQGLGEARDKTRSTLLSACLSLHTGGNMVNPYVHIVGKDSNSAILLFRM